MTKGRAQMVRTCLKFMPGSSSDLADEWRSQPTLTHELYTLASPALRRRRASRVMSTEERAVVTQKTRAVLARRTLGYGEEMDELDHAALPAVSRGASPAHRIVRI